MGPVQCQPEMMIQSSCSSIWPNQSVPLSREEGEKITKRVEVKLWKDRPLWDKQPQLGWWLPFWIRLVSDLDILYDCV